MVKLANQRVKVRYNDLKAAGIVGSRTDLFRKIKNGRLPPPQRDGIETQSRTWWWAEDIDKAVEAERKASSAKK